MQAQIKEKSDNFFFIDDNLLINKDQTRDLFEKLIPLKKKWGCQISIDALKDESFVKLMAKSGCVAVMVGFESVNSESLDAMNKKNNAPDEYAALIRNAKKHGIMIWGSFVFGCEQDKSDIFEKTYEFTMKHKLYLANFNTLNPMPGTPLYEDMKQKKRLLSEHWWRFEKYKYGEIMFQPKAMPIQTLKEECIKLRLEFNKYSNIFYRALDRKANCRNLSNLALFLSSNLTARKQIISKMAEIM